MNPNIFFGGGVFGCIYHIGVVRALYEANQTNLTVYANSAGAIIATCYVCNIPTDEITQIFANVATNTISKIIENPGKMGSYQLTEHAFDIFDRIHYLAPDAYKQCSGRLKIGINLDGLGFQWRDTFASNVDLFHTLLCSLNVPYLCNYDAQMDGVRCIDGGFGFVMSRDLPRDTFTITLYGKNDSDLDANIPFLHRILPPPNADWERYLKNGYDDMKYRLDTGTVKSRPKYPEFSLENMVSSNAIQMALCHLQAKMGGNYDYSVLVERYKQVNLRFNDVVVSASVTDPPPLRETGSDNGRIY